MTTITPSPIRDLPRSVRNRQNRRRGFTLVEMMVGAALASFILAGVMSTFLFLGRSGANIQNYSDMESQSRKALEVFAEDVRQAAAITWSSSTQVGLVVNAAPIVYTYNSILATFTRTDAAGTRILISGVTPGTFSFRAYNVAGAELPLATAANLAAASSSTKQLQISLEATRARSTLVSATNSVLSARFILRNKIVTA